MLYKGSCHCGHIAFQVEGTLTGAMSCNCSICGRKGALMWFVPRETLHLLTAVENASTYTFNKHLIQHRFCPKCGMHPYGEALDSKGAMVRPSTPRAPPWPRLTFVAWRA